jgi:bifunctional non-homologous end joining protein LigD
MLMRRRHIHVVYVVFDVLSLEGISLLRAPYSERRAQLEALDLNGLYWRTPDVSALRLDGPALFEAVCERELESRSEPAARIGQASAAGSRSRTAATGASSSSAALKQFV